MTCRPFRATTSFKLILIFQLKKYHWTICFVYGQYFIDSIWECIDVTNSLIQILQQSPIDKSVLGRKAEKLLPKSMMNQLNGNHVLFQY